MIEGPCRPVFVVGMNGSGTTMLVDSLGRHPELYGFPRETRVIPHLISTVGQLGDLNDDDNFLRVWKRVHGIPAFRLLNGGQIPPLPANWAAFPRDLASVLDAVFRHFAIRHGKIRWVEKTPQHVQHLECLHRVFPGAKFIHIIRDGRDCAASLHRRWKRTPEFTIYRWRNVVSMGRDQGAMLTDCYLEVKYEELTANPECGLQQICSFIELPFHPDVLVSGHPQSEHRGKLGRIEPNTGKWRMYFPAQRIERLERIAGDLLADLGYPVLHRYESEQPSAARLRYWRTTDYLRQYLLMLADKLRGGSGKPWFMLLRLPASALAQLRTNRF
jgi:hypothetical protein